MIKNRKGNQTKMITSPGSLGFVLKQITNFWHIHCSKVKKLSIGQVADFFLETNAISKNVNNEY